MQSLFNTISYADVLVRLQPEELAGVLIPLLREETDRLVNKQIDLPKFMSDMNDLSQYAEYRDQDTSEIIKHNHGVEAYPIERSREVMQAVREAVGWLIGQGLLVDNGSGGNHYNLSRRALDFRDATQFAAYVTARFLRREMLHPSIAEAAWQSFMRSDYPTAVFQSMRQVEVAVREAGGFDAEDYGVDMLRKAFKLGGPLADPHAAKAEREAVAHLFAGAYGAYKNPHSHRIVPMESAREAAEIITLASHLLHIVDARAAAKAAEDAA